jgi:uncharacterized protein (TIGR02231 family)
MKNSYFLIILLVASISFAQKVIVASATTKAVTVYTNSAEIIQTTTAVLPKGTSSIVINNVADYVNESTIQIGTPANVTILSVQFSDDYNSEYTASSGNTILKKVQDSITWIKKEIKKVAIDKLSTDKTIEILDKNQQVASANSGLNVAELIKLVDYYKPKRTELSNGLIALADKETKLNEQLRNLNARLRTSTATDDTLSDGKLIVNVFNETAGKVDFQISYLSSDAYWKPFYDLRVTSIEAPIDMMYKAEVVQNTGIDWKNIQLKLSSGNPNQNNQVPAVNPWFLQYEQIAYPVAASTFDKKLSSKVRGLMIQSEDIKEERSDALNEIVVTAAPNVISENQLSVSFDIDLPYDILSNGKAHTVSLKALQLPATYRYFAAPKQEKAAFLLAEIADYSKYNLLKGDATIIFEEMYVGKTTINPNQTTDTLRLSMGRDKKIAITREKVADKSGTKFFSSKKEQTFTYDITVRNNKKEAAAILLKEHYPLSSDKDIEIELLQSDKAKINAETGILSWDLELKPNETKKIRISYRVKYPKDRILENL